MKLRTRKTLASFAIVLLARTAGAESSGAPPWQEGFTARLEALALLQTLNAELLSHDSATLTLDRWCAAHRLASPARIVAERERVDGAYQAPTDEQRQLLGVNAMETIRYRRVRLICGAHVLSEADNWYVPARLTLASLVALTAGLGNGRPVGGVPRGDTHHTPRGAGASRCADTAGRNAVQ